MDQVRGEGQLSKQAWDRLHRLVIVNYISDCDVEAMKDFHRFSIVCVSRSVSGL